MTTDNNDTDSTTDDDADAPTDGEPTESDESPDPAARTPGGGLGPEPEPIEPAAPEEFGLVQAWWGDGKGKTTAAMGMGFRAAGHGYRVHMLQFMKGGADSVEGVRGEYNAIAAMPGFSYENAGHYGWHGLLDGSGDDEHEAKASAAFERAEDLVAGAADADLAAPIPLDGETRCCTRPIADSSTPRRSSRSRSRSRRPSNSSSPEATASPTTSTGLPT